MIPQFSYTQLSDVNGWIKRIRDIGLKIFMKKRYDDVMDEVAKDVGLQQRTQRVFGIGEKFVGAMSYTSNSPATWYFRALSILCTKTQAVSA